MDPTPKLTPSTRVKEKKELTPGEKEIVSNLENLTFLDTRSKIFILLIWKRLKMASSMRVDVKAFPSSMEDLQSFAHKAGLFFKAGDFTHNNKYGLDYKQTCFITNNPKNLELFPDVWMGDHLNDTKVIFEMGRMSGYPKTAIDTFNQLATFPEEERKNQRRKLFLSEEEKKVLFPPELFRMSATFLMSREHWKTELETIRKWVEEIKLSSPKLYDKLNEVFGGGN